MFLACCPVHIVAREGVHCGTVQYWFSRDTPAPVSRWMAGRSTPAGRSMCTSHWSMQSTRMLGRSPRSELVMRVSSRVGRGMVRNVGCHRQQEVEAVLFAHQLRRSDE